MENKVQVELLENVISFGKDKEIYGVKGDIVNLICAFSNVLIVENKQKNKFPVRIDKTNYKNNRPKKGSY